MALFLFVASVICLTTELKFETKRKADDISTRLDRKIFPLKFKNFRGGEFFAERHRKKSQEEPVTTDLMAVSDDLGKRVRTILFKFASGIQLQDDIEKGAIESQRRRT